MSRPLRIALTVDPYIPVPPATYGGFERIVAWLVEDLTARGHSVTMWAHPESRTPARLMAYGVPPHTGRRARAGELWQVGASLFARRHQFDLVHSFGRLAALLPVLPWRSLAKVQSYGRYIPWTGVRRAAALAGESLTFTACSDRLWHKDDLRLRAGRWQTVYNGVDFGLYEPAETVDADAPLVFLGRLEHIKGAHHAIRVALASGRRLLIAGNKVDTPDGRAYFEAAIAPHLSHPLIDYVGPVNDAEKNDILRRSAALLMLIEWEEPFGIVMVEAMACGTPVIGFPLGAVPEVVTEGTTGFIVGSLVEAEAAIQRLHRIDRAAVRAVAAQRFSHQVIVGQYEALYYECIERCAHRQAVAAL